MTIKSADTWQNNGLLIADVVALGYIRPTDNVVDLTYGKGLWWSRYWHPDDLFLGLIWKHDPDLPTDVKHPVALIEDFGRTDLPDDWADVVAYDPPYVAMGGRATSHHAAFMDAYGLRHAAATPPLLHQDNLRGAAEAVRICKPGGLILWKTKNYISSGKLHVQTMWTWRDAVAMGLEVEDEFRHVGHTLGQPPGRRQVHARQNSSTLFIFRKARR